MSFCAPRPSPFEPRGFEHAVEHLAVVDLDDVVAALDAEALHGVGGHHADFSVRRDGGRSHSIGVELHELAEAAGAGLFVAKHEARAKAAIGLGQLVEMLRHIAGQRRGEIVAQRQPLVVVVLEGKHALVGAILIGQELAQRLGVFDERRLDGFEAIELVDLADGLHHAGGAGDLGGSAVRESARQPRLHRLLIALLAHRPENPAPCALRAL